MKKVRVAIVLDKSSSMTSLRKEAIQMFNDQLKALNKQKNTTLSLFTFSSEIDEKVFNKPTNDIPPLTFETYCPYGNTALYDAMGKAIDRLTSLEEMTDPDTNFLIITITDGEENASSKFTGQRLADHIQLLQKTGRWVFTFCGANIDVEKMQHQLNIPKGNTYVWQADAQGMQQTSYVNTRGLDGYFKNLSSPNFQSQAQGNQNFYSPDITTSDDKQKGNK